MFKFCIFALALSAVSCTQLRLGFPQRPRGLADDLADILELIPRDEIIAIIGEYVAKDTEVQEVLTYLQGDEWAGLVATVGSHPSWISFKEIVGAAGVDVDAIVGDIHELINGVEIPDSGDDFGGVRAMLDEILDIIPFDDLIALLDEKLSESEAFQEFYYVISGDESRQFVNEILELEEVVHIIATLRGYGVDVDRIIEWVQDFLGWNRDARIEYL